MVRLIPPPPPEENISRHLNELKEKLAEATDPNQKRLLELNLANFLRMYPDAIKPKSQEELEAVVFTKFKEG